MKYWRALPYACIVLVAAAAAAQQRPIFEPDDFVDPRQHDAPIFISRLVAGAVRDFVDDYRPLGKDAGVLYLTNSLFWSHWQFDYKHSEVRGENKSPDPVRCGCDPPLYFPTPPPPGATPPAPRPGSRDTVDVGFYRRKQIGAADPPIALRTRLTFSQENLTTNIRSFTTGEIVERRSGHDRSIGVDADTHFVVGGHNVWGSLLYARTSTSGTLADRTQQEFAYVARPPGYSVGRVLARATLTVGGVTNRGGTALNVVNPALEAFWHDHTTQANVHLVWSPLTMRDGSATGWQTRHQIALFVDRALYVKLFRHGD